MTCRCLASDRLAARIWALFRAVRMARCHLSHLRSSLTALRPSKLIAEFARRRHCSGFRMSCCRPAAASRRKSLPTTMYPEPTLLRRSSPARSIVHQLIRLVRRQYRRISGGNEQIGRTGQSRPGLFALGFCRCAARRPFHRGASASLPLLAPPAGDSARRGLAVAASWLHPAH